MVEITTTTDTHIDVTAGLYMPGDVESDTIDVSVFGKDYAVLRVSTPDVDGNITTVVLRNLHLDHLEELYSMLGDAIAEMNDETAEEADTPGEVIPPQCVHHKERSKRLANEKHTYIVMVRGSSDDVPILVTNDSDEAMQCAEAADWNSGQPETDIIGVGMDCPVAVAIYIFDGAGRLESVRQIKDLEDAEEADDE